MNIEDCSKIWLQEYNYLHYIREPDYVHKLGLLALFGAFVPNAQEFINSNIRQFILLNKHATVHQAKMHLNKTVARCKLYFEEPETRYWVQKRDVNNNIVEECNAFTPNSFEAPDKDHAELLAFVTKF